MDAHKHCEARDSSPVACQDVSMIKDCLILKRRALRPSETSASIYQSIRRSIPEDWDRNQHRCINLKSRMAKITNWRSPRTCQKFRDLLQNTGVSIRKHRQQDFKYVTMRKR